MTSYPGGGGGAPSTGSAASSSSTSSSGAGSAATLRGEHQQHRQQRQHHQVNAAVEVTPGDDDAKADDQGDGGGGDDRGEGGHEGDYDMVGPSASAREAAAAAAETRAFGSNRGAARAAGQGQTSQQESGGARRLSSSRTPYLRRCLSLVGLEDLPDRALARALFSGFLDSLEVASTLRYTSKRVMMVASTACKVMDLHGIALNDKNLASVAAGFPRLVYVDLSFCKGLGEETTASLRPCKQTLQTLSLRGTGASPTVVEGLRYFPRLTNLDLSQNVASDSRRVTAASLVEGLSGLERLEKLSLAWNKGVTDEVVENLCAGVTGLTVLDLGLCPKITSRSVQALSSQRSLRVLSLRACVNISDDAVEELIVACPGLSNLDLAHLPNITGRSLRALVHLRGLKKMDLRCCELLTTADVVAFRAARPFTRVAELRAWWP